MFQSSSVWIRSGRNNDVCHRNVHNKFQSSSVWIRSGSYTIDMSTIITQSGFNPLLSGYGLEVLNGFGGKKSGQSFNPLMSGYGLES